MKQQKIFAEYLDHLGTDLTVVNAARASFGKESQMADVSEHWERKGTRMRLKPADANLIRFLATGFRKAEWDEFLGDIMRAVQNSCDFESAKAKLTPMLHAYKRKAQHWAPFAHPHVQIRVSMPIFLARQFVKHQVGGTWSEESRRYISDEPGVWFPSEWHTRPEDIKQGSGGLVDDQFGADRIAKHSVTTSLQCYDDLLNGGVAPEEARTVLPLNMMTTVVWTGSLLFWSRVCNQRVDSHAQLAAQELGKLISDIVGPLYPVSWKELTC